MFWPCHPLIPFPCTIYTCLGCIKHPFCFPLSPFPFPLSLLLIFYSFLSLKVHYSRKNSCLPLHFAYSPSNCTFQAGYKSHFSLERWAKPNEAQKPSTRRKTPHSISLKRSCWEKDLLENTCQPPVLSGGVITSPISSALGWVRTWSRLCFPCIPHNSAEYPASVWVWAGVAQPFVSSWEVVAVHDAAETLPGANTTMPIDSLQWSYCMACSVPSRFLLKLAWV